MSPSIPPELIPLILAHISWDSKHKSLNRCALVCRDWTIISRRIAFNKLYITGQSLSRKQRTQKVSRFLQLCGSPYETFSKSRVHTLEFLEWPRYHPDPESPEKHKLDVNKLLEWVSTDRKKNLSSLFPNLKRLEIIGTIYWYSLSNLAKNALHDGFTTVTELKVAYLRLEDECDEFINLINSFPSLKSLDLCGIYNFSFLSPPKTSMVVLNPDIERIAIDSLSEIDVFRTLIPTPRLKTLQLEGHVLFEELAGVDELRLVAEELLRSVSSTLETFICKAFCFNGGIALFSYLSILDLSGMTNLQRLEFDFRSFKPSYYPSSVIDVLDRVSRSSDSAHLQVINIPFLPELSEAANFLKLDAVILRRPYFSSLRELKCQFSCDFTIKDVSRQRKRKYKRKSQWYTKPDEDSMAGKALQERIREFKAVFPWCEKRGVLVVDVEYSYDPPISFKGKMASTARRAVYRLRRWVRLG
ncbi:hypothetical protein WG66_002212 [Moniliophthora roreri]|uniref:F-box domain-containing protein n=1 Tax=Moniliophthora roreri TaxID=221103 RepID=A0A0W0GDS7_MONRR|nr:hypothetical protein WG66_002212 [Moniliophthora roreri]